jgi:Putative threonine efflux protein
MVAFPIDGVKNALQVFTRLMMFEIQKTRIDHIALDEKIRRAQSGEQDENNKKDLVADGHQDSLGPCVGRTMALNMYPSSRSWTSWKKAGLALPARTGRKGFAFARGLSRGRRGYFRGLLGRDKMLELFTVATITILAVISPGADFAMVTRNSMMLSRRAGMLTAAGIALGVLVHVAYSLLGVGLVISRSILLFSLIKYMGAAYLVYLGVTMLRARAEVSGVARVRALRILARCASVF